MDKIGFNMVIGCGEYHRTIFRYDNICHISCFKGNKEEVINAIGDKYKGRAKDIYIAKIEELYNKDITESDVDVTLNYNYAIEHASKECRLDVIRYLVSKGGGVTSRNNIAIRLASENGCLDVVKYLVSKGANVADLNNCSLEWASTNGHLEVVKYLISKGADAAMAGSRSIKLANSNGHSELVDYLLSQGAKL